HFLPALLLLVWLAFDLASGIRVVLPLRSVYLWGWSVLPLFVCFLLLALYCLDVIRQRIERLSLLVIILVPFIAFAILSQRNHWREQAVAALWPRIGFGHALIAELPDTEK